MVIRRYILHYNTHTDNDYADNKEFMIETKLKLKSIQQCC